MDSGCQVSDIGMVPTPVLYFATHTSGATSGVMITAATPPAYNGLKIVSPVRPLWRPDHGPAPTPAAEQPARR
ncbi:hypothetical protein ULG90_18330 [Halopseudomonas pachastrellae]|nr:hypothetical protein ULG90_18330 [Halopseudomonas pachastrellae]